VYIINNLCKPVILHLLVCSCCWIAEKGLTLEKETGFSSSHSIPQMPTYTLTSGTSLGIRATRPTRTTRTNTFTLGSLQGMNTFSFPNLVPGVGSLGLNNNNNPASLFFNSATPYTVASPSAPLPPLHDNFLRGIIPVLQTPFTADGTVGK
jgi:hypothetical protein